MLKQPMNWQLRTAFSKSGDFTGHVFSLTFVQLSPKHAGFIFYNTDECLGQNVQETACIKKKITTKKRSYTHDKEIGSE